MAARLVPHAVLSALALLACSDKASPSPGDPSADAGPPNGFDACEKTLFRNFLKSCSTRADCGGGILECDITKKFATTPRCHSRLCEEDIDCEEAFGLSCTGELHWQCRASNQLVPKECRVVEGPRP